MTWEHISKPLNRALQNMLKEMERHDAQEAEAPRRKRAAAAKRPIRREGVNPNRGE
jgi:hypothetical protein